MDKGTTLKAGLAVGLLVASTLTAVLLDRRMGFTYYPHREGSILPLPGLEVWWYGRCEETGYRTNRFLRINAFVNKGKAVEMQTDSSLMCGSPERF